MNLRYDYLEDPSNQELGQIELIEDGRINAESSPGWATLGVLHKNFDQSF